MSVVEVLVVLVIVLVVGLGIVRSLAWASGQLLNRTDVALASAVQAQHAIDLIGADLEQASSSAGLACGPNFLSMMINNQQVIYFRQTIPSPGFSANTLLRQTPLGGTQPVTGGITALETNCSIPGLVTVGLNAQVTKAGFVADQSLMTKVLLQNP